MSFFAASRESSDRREIPRENADSLRVKRNFSTGEVDPTVKPAGEAENEDVEANEVSFTHSS
jgi:hypothetical protein